MKTTISLLLIFLLSLYAFGQPDSGRIDTAAYRFPEKDSEFSVSLPAKPVFEVSFNAGSGLISAEVKTADGFLKAESLKYGKTKPFAKNADKTLTEFPLKYAEAAGLSNSKLETGTDTVGKFTKLRGTKEVNGVSMTFEIRFYFGNTELIGLSAAGASDSYPSADITKFFDSLAFDSSYRPKKSKDKKSADLNGRATSLPQPAYPQAARAVRASGAVNVLVSLDLDGNVVSATAITGHPLLRRACEQAALQAKFNPYLIYGEKVRVTGIIIYNFIP